MSRKKSAHAVSVSAARRSDPFDDPTSIGNVLLKLGKVNHTQLLQAVGQRVHFDEMLLGALLRQMGYITEFDIAQAMKIQAEMRGGNPLAAELDVLQAKMDESAAGARELSARLKKLRKTRPVQTGGGGNFQLLPMVAFARG